jgi:hypothetical protein
MKEAEGLSKEAELIPPVWRDWHTVGCEFRRFEGLSQLDQEAVMRGETIASKVVINDDMLWGSIFRYEASMSPEALASIFHDYDGQYRFVPGMPETRVLHRTGKLHRVFHRINPITFFSHGAQTSWPSWLYKALCYSYQLDEEVFSTPTADGPGYAIRWTIPLETQVLGARENGEIMFTQMGVGTLISYNNATEPFGYNVLKAILPKGLLHRLYISLGNTACDYYKRTVEGFLDIAQEMNADDIQSDIDKMLAQPGLQ